MSNLLKFQQKKSIDVTSDAVRDAIKKMQEDKMYILVFGEDGSHNLLSGTVHQMMQWISIVENEGGPIDFVYQVLDHNVGEFLKDHDLYGDDDSAA